MIERCYLEITNVCNQACPFCPGNKRSKHGLTATEFDILTDKLAGQVRFLYFHLMGEPTMHPCLPEFLVKARQKGFIPVLTTNGVLLKGLVADAIVAAAPYKVHISLQSVASFMSDTSSISVTFSTAVASSSCNNQSSSGEICTDRSGSKARPIDDYLENVVTFAVNAARNGIIVILRLWNQGGNETANGRIIDLLSQYFPKPWTERPDGFKISDHIFLEYDKTFAWPDLSGEPYVGDVFCYALRNQIGILSDGTVVPCCLDHEGNVALGNLFEESLQAILQSSRAQKIYQGFTRHQAVEPLCRTCGYANITKHFRK